LKHELKELKQAHHDFVESTWKYQELMSARQVKLITLLSEYIPKDEFDKLLKEI